MADLGKAYVQIVPSAEGISGSIEGVLGPEAESAGKKSGAAITSALSSSMSRSGAQLTNAVSRPIAEALGGAVKLTAEFDAGMSQVQAISGATGEEMNKLRDLAREMGATTKFTASEAAEGLNYMAMAGWKTDQMMNGLPGILNLAAASGEELGRTSDIVTDALTAFGMTAEQSGTFADILAAASSNANTNVSMMGESFKYAAPVVGSLFQDAAGGSEQAAKDTAVALGLMGNAGIKASQAGTSLRTLLTNMAKPTDDMVTAMEALGVSLDDGHGGMNSLATIMEQLRGGFGELKISEEDFNTSLAELDQQLEDGTINESMYNEALAELTERAYGAEGAEKAKYAAMLAGSRGMSALLAIVNATSEDYDKLTAAVETSSDVIVKTADGSIMTMNDALASGAEVIEQYNGQAEAMASIMQDNLSGDVTKLSSATQELSISFGEMMVPVLRDVVANLQGVVDWLNSLDPKTKNTIITIGMIVAAAGPLLLIGGKVIGGISTIAGGLANLGGKITGFGSSVASVAAPAATAGASFATMAGQALQLIAAAAAVWIISQALSTLAGTAIELAAAGWPAIAVMGGLVVAVVGLMGAAAALGPAMTAGALGIGVFGAAMVGIGAGIDLASQGIATILEAVGNLTAVISENADGINSVVSNIGDTFGGVLTTISDGIATVIDSISGGLSSVLDSVAGIFDSMGEAALNAGTGFEMLSNAVINLVSNTGVLDLGATLTTVSKGVKDISKAASDAGSSATGLKNMATGFKSLGSAAQSSSKTMTLFATTTTSSMSKVKAAFNITSSLVSSMRSAMSSVYSAAASGISSLRSLFSNTRFSFYQHISVPHFSMNGAFDAQSGSVPSISTVWYARAAELGARFTSPQIIGVGDAAQPEILLGEEKLKKLVKGGSTVNNYITVNGAEDPQAWAAKFARQIKLEMRMA